MTIQALKSSREKTGPEGAAVTCARRHQRAAAPQRRFLHPLAPAEALKRVGSGRGAACFPALRRLPLSPPGYSRGPSLKFPSLPGCSSQDVGRGTLKCQPRASEPLVLVCDEVPSPLAALWPLLCSRQLQGFPRRRGNREQGQEEELPGAVSVSP